MNKTRHRKFSPKFLQVIQLRNVWTKTSHAGLLDSKAQTSLQRAHPGGRRREDCTLPRGWSEPWWAGNPEEGVRTEQSGFKWAKALRQTANWNPQVLPTEDFPTYSHIQQQFFFKSDFTITHLLIFSALDTLGLKRRKKKAEKGWGGRGKRTERVSHFLGGLCPSFHSIFTSGGIEA